MFNRKIAGVLLAAVMVTGLGASALAAGGDRGAEPSPQPFFDEEFIELYTHSDGGNAYAVTEKVLKFFAEDPDRFLLELSQLDGELKDSLTITLIAETYYNTPDFAQFKLWLAGVEDEAISPVAQEVLRRAEEYEAEALAWKERYDAWIKEPAPGGIFDASILTRAAKMWKEGTWDPFNNEEYCNYAYHLYLLDPGLFAQTISEMAEETRDQFLSKFADHARWYHAEVSKFADEETTGRPLSVEEMDDKGIEVMNILAAIQEDPEEALSRVKEAGGVWAAVLEAPAGSSEPSGAPSDTPDAEPVPNTVIWVAVGCCLLVGVVWGARKGRKKT